jgi:DNA repair protein RadA/Sms
MYQGGGIAGPKTPSTSSIRFSTSRAKGCWSTVSLRATKNRFGSVDEIGVFRMTAEGLIAVRNPSELSRGIVSAIRRAAL